MTEPSMWTRLTEENPEHSAAYIQRFKDLAAAGQDLVGEARLVDAMAPRGARILDAGSGTGRIAAHLAAVGHDVVGVDGDPVLVAAADVDAPGPRYLVSDLAELDLPAQGVPEPFAAALRAVKATLDPAGVLNPGVLIGPV